ncbi:MAG: type I restriction endonuclease subunit R [Desulfarculus sp.]|nr:type I restriction endonuclease subunit R [Desulfarculus sp.]
MTPPPSPASHYSEDSLVEQPAIALFGDLGWQTVNLYNEWASGKSSQGRETEHEVFLRPRLRAALEALNPTLAGEVIDQALEELTRDRSSMLPVRANQEVYRLLKEGVPVKVQDSHGNPDVQTVRVMDWRQPANNHFLLASQFWVSGDMYRRRADLVGFVNGIPLVFVELKATHKNLKNAYDGNLSDYRYSVPQLFIPNALVMLSNGSQTRLGSMTAEWDHFVDWKRINDEGEQGVVSLETAIRGTCQPERLLDMVENFTVFEEVRGGLAKKVAKNHQYLGVNRAIAAVDNLGDNQGRLGVFWHTQGSGKSLSMIFFSQKILRTMPGNWTFLVVTDGKDLDTQIYKTFAACGAVTESEAHATSGEHLRQLLGEDHRYVFTLIHKFGTPKGEDHPKLSDRRDIIVITDEAHRSQYDILAMRMRQALPQAAFIGFTGTPLLAGEERTREVFGDYVSIYPYAQSVEDGATVPLYYENRIPELQLVNEDLNDDMEALLEAAVLDQEQERRLEREFVREYHLITRDERLEKIAEDLVTHFLGRGYRGKAMVICIDKATAVRMYDKVQAHWQARLIKLRESLAGAKGEDREVLEAQVREMEATDMAVVVSQSQNEVAELAAKGLDIIPHRQRMVKDPELDEKFKDPKDPFRLVFVCAMWITGFDVPTCSTIYLDKPMRNHTLMQTIARANRKVPGKVAGLIVDYVGVFRELQKALAIYGRPTGGGGDQPITDKSELVEYLKQFLAEVAAFCGGLGIDLEAIKQAQGFEKVKLLDDAVEELIKTEETKRGYLQQTATVARVYRAILPDPLASHLAADVVLLAVLAEKIKSLAPTPDISEIMADVEKLLNDSIATQGYVIRAATPAAEPLIDLSKIDFEALKTKFRSSRKRTEIEKIKALIGQKLQVMVRLNRSRMDYLEKFQKMIDEYNAGSMNLEDFFQELLRFAQGLNEEEKRAMAEGLTEEELAIFDILTKPVPKLTRKQEVEVKKVAKDLLETLKREKLVLDWRSRQQTRAGVRKAIEDTLDRLPQDLYPQDIYDQKCDLTYQHVYDAYYGPGQSAYQAPA